MKKLLQIAFASLIALSGLFSCTEANKGLNNGNNEIDDDIINISAGITDFSGETLNVSNTRKIGKESFELNDKIYLFISPKGLSSSAKTEFKLSSKGWNPQLKWSELGANTANFKAFYPQVDVKDGIYIHSISDNQSGVLDYNASDLLTSHVTASKGDNVNLNFSHLMSRVKVELSTDGSVDLSSAVVRVKSASSIAINLTDMTLGQLSDKMVNVVARAYDNAYYAIVCPQKIRQEWKENSWIEVEAGGKIYNFPASGTLNSQPFIDLKSGREVTIKLSLSNQPGPKPDPEPEPEPNPQPGDFVGKTVWVKGLKNIPDPDTWKNIWTYTSNQGTFKADGLKWDASYGWYDCKKIYPNGYEPVFEELCGPYDDLYCWAATAANMIYWWLDINKENIERYGKYTGPKKYGWDDDTADNEWRKHFHTEVFDFFKEHFPNKGNDVNSVLSWFFTGCYATSLNVSASEAAFFKDVFGDKVAVSRSHGVSAGRFTDVVKEALAEGRVLGFSHYIGTYNSHAVNLWGATFDESGEITHIYVTDSNAGRYVRQEETMTQTPAGLEKRAVKVIKGYTCMESSVPGDFSLKIYQAYSIDTMQDKWEAYFAK